MRWKLGVCFALAGAAALGAAPQRDITLAAIPYPLQAGSEHGKVSLSPAGLLITATRGSDLFVNFDGTEIADKTPRVLFTPVGDFIFSARVNAGFHRQFDGGALLVYADQAHWAKLLFECAKSGQAGVSSTVARGVGDDAHHGAVPGQAMYLKIARRKEMFVFYTSPDGARWNMVRTFALAPGARVKVGFSSQSPVGDSFAAEFTDIRFRSASFKDYWQGE